MTPGYKAAPVLSIAVFRLLLSVIRTTKSGSGISVNSNHTYVRPMSTPTALQPEQRALTWTEHDLQQLNIEIIDVPSTEIADQAFHKANLSYEQPPAADTDASCRPWYDDFCWLLVE